MLHLSGLGIFGVQGQVVDLTTKTFDESVQDGNLWLLEFYAPWCGHCKKLAPILDEVAIEVGDKMKIGKVDATAETKLAKRYAVNSYPTLKFARNGDLDTLQPYEGPRTHQGLVNFAQKMTGPAVTRGASASKVQQFLEEGKIVVVLGDASPQGGGSHAAQAFAIAGQNLQHMEVEFAIVEDAGALAELGLGKSGVSVAKLEKGEKPIFYDGKHDTESLEAWSKINSIPLVVELGQHNFRQVGELGPLMAIGVVDPEQTKETEAFVQSLKDVARTLPSEDKEKFVFGYIDGKKWARFVKQFNIKGDLPRLFVLDYQSKSFFEDPEVDEFEEIETFLKDINSGKVPAHREGLTALPSKMWNKLVDAYPYSLLFLIPIVMLIWAFWMDSEEEEEKPKEE